MRNTEKLEQSLQIDNVHHIYIPYINDIANIFSIITVEQLLAYHTADALNREIDGPRNLAKSITVE